MSESNRNYESLINTINPSGSREQRMQAVVDLLWVAFAGQGYSWVGFYIDRPDAIDGERMILGPRRDKPACSPIGLHGVCGKALLSKETLIVRDVKELGDDYIACDPRDQSEIVIPLIDEHGICWGVLDIDSYEIGAFDKSDLRGLSVLLRTAELLAG